ncbi:MAG: hypothetical protein LBD31_10905 [Treponema sp.]|jgi:histidinol phosphatase-like PHP family hydrolase|nr:hypothetical protein [Treponema sp.]
MNIYTDIEDEVDAVRNTIYDEIKDMSAAEELAYFNAAAEEAQTKYHIRVIPGIPEGAVY